MMVARMAMQTCEDSSGKERVSEDVVDLRVWFLWLRRSNTREVRYLKAVDYVMRKVEKE